MDRFLAPAPIRRQDNSNSTSRVPKQLMKFILPTYEELISKIRSNEHAHLKLTRTGQQHLVPTTKGLMLFMPSKSDKTYVYTEDSKRGMNKDDLADAMNSRDKRFGDFSEERIWLWKDGASKCITAMLKDLVELHDTLARIFKVTDENRLQVNGQMRTTCLTAETGDFLKACRFIVLSEMCMYSTKVKLPVPISIYQYALPRVLQADVICRGTYYQESDVLAWRSATLREVTGFEKMADGTSYVSSLRYYLTDDRAEFWTGGSVMVTLGPMKMRESEWQSKRIGFSRTVLPVMEDDNEESETDQEQEDDIKVD